MINIKEIYEEISSQKNKYFTLNQEEDKISFLTSKKSGANYGAMKILDYVVLASTESPFEMFEMFEKNYKELKEELSDEIFEMNPILEATIMDGATYNLLSPVLQNLLYQVSEISVWRDQEEDQTYALINAHSEEEEEFGFIGLLFFCRIDFS